jgi:hypothetical protein
MLVGVVLPEHLDFRDRGVREVTFALLDELDGRAVLRGVPQTRRECFAGLGGEGHVVGGGDFEASVVDASCGESGVAE